MANGRVAWSSWNFDWELNPGPQKDGITIRNAFFKGRSVLYKASLPLVRVEYYRPVFYFWMGPFVDPLNEDKALPTPQDPFSKVSISTFPSGGMQVLRVCAYYVISAYHLIQSWDFFENGIIMPKLFSKGLVFPYDHKHHVYWRLDFDIDGFANNQLLEWNGNTGWLPIGRETGSVKDPNAFRLWQVRNKGTGRSYAMYPGVDDGTADGFSRRDVWHLAYRGTEDRQGQQGNAYDDQLDSYLNGESTDGADVVWWYAAHLFHRASEPTDEWHSCGPILYPYDWPS